MHVQQETWFGDAGDDREDPTLVWTGSRPPVEQFDTAPPTSSSSAPLVLWSVIGALALFGAAIIMRGLVVVATERLPNARAEVREPPARTALTTKPARVPPPLPIESEAIVTTTIATPPEVESTHRPIAHAHPRRAHAKKAIHPSAPGTLRINSLPWAEVYVDGTLVGSTPQSQLSMKPGRHRVKLVNEQMALRKTFDVYILSGQVTTRSENLSL